MTVADLKAHLKPFGDDWEIEFSGLTFYRTKARGERLVNIEFAEPFEQIHTPGTKNPDLILRIKSREAGEETE